VLIQVYHSRGQAARGHFAVDIILVQFVPLKAFESVCVRGGGGGVLACS